MLQSSPFSPRGHVLVLGVCLVGFALFFLLALLLDPIDAAFTAYLALVMAAISASDFRRFVVPDYLSLPSIPIGMMANSLVMHDAILPGLQESLLGMAAGGGAFYLVRVIFRWLRGVEGLGMGDVKLAAVAGAWLGPAILPETCLGATMAALVFALAIQLTNSNSLSQGLKIPFGSFIAPAIFVAWAFRLWEVDAFIS